MRAKTSNYIVLRRQTEMVCRLFFCLCENNKRYYADLTLYYDVLLSYNVITRRRLPMTVRERILAIKLLEKQDHNPEYANRIGIRVSIVKKDPKQMEVKYVWVIRAGFVLLDILWLHPINVQSCLGDGKNSCRCSVYYGTANTYWLFAVRWRDRPLATGHPNCNCLGNS